MIINGGRIGRRSSLRQDLITLGGIFIVASLIIIALGWGAIDRVNVESGDFAANSLQVLEAKELSLLEGHYSRFGFYHPGPWLLYVLAFGEWFFFDLTSLTPSAFSGQLIAIAIYNALWIVISVIAIRLWGLSWRVTALVVGIFLLSLSLFDHQFINGAWFPLVSSLTFGVLLFAVIGFLSGNMPSLFLVGISSGVLINAHSSFIPIVGIILLAVLLTGLFSRPHPVRHLLTPEGRNSLVGFFVALLVFLTPFIIRTLRDWPGPLADYLSYSPADQGKQQQSIGHAIDFVAQFWGGLVPFTIGMIVAISLVIFGSKNRGNDRIYLRNIGITVIAAVIAVIFYTYFGVDSFEHSYLLYFSYAIPAVLTASLIPLIARPIDALGRPIAVVGLIALLLWIVWLHRPTAYPDDYNRPEILELDAFISQAQSSNQPVVLDLDNRETWGQIWPVLAGARLHALRDQRSTWCLNEGWVLLFTPEAQCDIAELESPDRYKVTFDPDSSESVANLRFTRVPRA